MKSLRKRIIIGCVLLSIITLICGGWAVFRILGYQSTFQKDVAYISQRIVFTEDLVSSLERMDSAQLLFLLGRTEQAENMFAENEDKVVATLKNLNLAITDAEGQAIISTIEKNYSLYLQAFISMQSDLSSGRDTGSRYSTEAFPIFQSLSDDSQLLLKLNQDEMIELAQDSEDVLKSVKNVIMIVAALTIISTVTLGVSFVRSVFNPLQQLTKHLRFTRMGRSAGLNETAGSEELAELARELSHMTRLLHDYDRFYKNSQIMEEKNKLDYEPLVSVPVTDTPTAKVSGRIMDENIKMDIQDVSVLDLVETAVETLRSQAEAKDIRLVKDIPADLPQIEADVNKVLWVLTNLIGNALRFTQSGGQVVVSARAITDQVYVSVSDTGVGMPKEYQEKVFDKFVQMKGKAESPRGTGLGLTIAKEIVQAHHGQIWVESEKEKGATFTFTIPVKPA